MKTLRLLILSMGLVAAALVTSFFLRSPEPASCQPDGCRYPEATGRQPYPTELSARFEQAGMGQLGTGAPALPKVYKGYPTYVPVTGHVPCILMKAVAYTESGWKQFSASFGQTGSTVISFDCGYGIMQITSGMGTAAPLPGWDPTRVAADPVYNIGTGALFIASKWNAVPNFIGGNDPRITEDWYYAIWAYNGFGWVNNPNNTDRFDPNRTPFNGTQARSKYPYQELVWGYAANPPSVNGERLWTAEALTLPERSLITNPPAVYIPRPIPFHFSCGATNNFYCPALIK